ncbi:WXG100 family type VII secretion target [Nocardia sp. NPDC049149]|uniref:WXG100 family type VII secretion target n=1 Tax=Nocardia sp. NPDC049149 TaxID=3364315 RepID=UPI003721EF18
MKGFVVKVGVTSGELRSAAGKMGKLRDQVHDILTTLETSLAARGTAWGGDGYGSTFADGPEGYLAAHKNLTEGLGNTAKTLGSYCDGQYKAADLLDGMDRRSAGSFR